MNGVPDFIKERHAKHCYQCDPAYGEGVAKALGMNIDFSDVKQYYKYFLHNKDTLSE